MIGVLAHPAEHAVVQEFFELFKTPWEFHRRDQAYDVLLCSGDHDFQEDYAKLILIYSGQPLQVDVGQETEAVSPERQGRMLLYREAALPIYGEHLLFRGTDSDLVDEKSKEPAMHVRQSLSGMRIRIGYNLFEEVRTLLTVGQPACNAGIPTLDLHIALLRDVILASGAPLMEIPPVPKGYRFIACLTHDVDHPSIRQHRFDNTILGFLYRALFRSLFDVIRGRTPVRHLLTNWGAVLKLPFVHLGLASDFWHTFEQYLKLEDGLPSSFFFIPFRGSPGQRMDGPAPSRRAARYRAKDFAATVQTLMASGCEIGLHGIDAWLDASKGWAELEEIRQITGQSEVGVRMHWLYFRDRSPAALEQAGADYDSTVGYNETIGYRAGTTQVYKLLTAEKLLELPLHIMDTALFYPAYLNLSPQDARKRIGTILDNAVQFGGCVTVNWHDRSIAPERLWGAFYRQLIQELLDRGAWFATAAQTVSWFRARRSVTFQHGQTTCGSIASCAGVHLCIQQECKN
ncbi:MAG: hypothetical protein IT165_26615 [Bryobacterales bacterium]|nr:hypothetical protein [Bryobacterales bacterium]